jgi:hypothetical protein
MANLQTPQSSLPPVQPVAPPVDPVQVPAYQTVQPVPVQPVILQQPAVAEVPPQTPDLHRDEAGVLEVRIYGHSALYYWWPVWAIGYLMALLTYLHGQPHEIGKTTELFHPSSSSGVIFFLTLFLVILITNVSVRGLASGMVILAIMLAVVLLAYFDLWDRILHWLGDLSIHLNLGAYFWFSTLLFLAWVLAVFVFDRLTYWNIKPGQITQEYVLGAGSLSYDTRGMLLEKHRNDLFRHWILGLGSGDLKINTTGATRDVIDISNVLFLGTKIEAIQRMIAIRPDEFGNAAVK